MSRPSQLLRQERRPCSVRLQLRDEFLDAAPMRRGGMRAREQPDDIQGRSTLRQGEHGSPALCPRLVHIYTIARDFLMHRLNAFM